MTTNQAIQIVVRAAEAHANGSQHCLEILRACEMVREMSKPMSNLPPGTTDKDIGGEVADDYQRQCEEDAGEEKRQRAITAPPAPAPGEP